MWGRGGECRHLGTQSPSVLLGGPCGFPLELLHLDNRWEKEKGGMEVLWAHTYSSYNGQMVSYCGREAGSGVLCLPQMEKEMVGGRTSQFLSHVTSRTWDYFSKRKETRETGKASGRGEGRRWNGASSQCLEEKEERKRAGKPGLQS